MRLFVSSFAILLIQACTPASLKHGSKIECSYTFAYTDFSGSDVELFSDEDNLFSGFISLGDQSTGLNFTQKITLADMNEFSVTIDNKKYVKKMPGNCMDGVVYIKPYEPFLRVTEDIDPIVY